MSVGLVVEGGGMRGIFAAGVLDYLMDQEIVFPNIIGVSSGATHACSYASGQRGRAFEAFTDFLDDPEFCSVRNLRKTGDYYGVDFVYHKIPEKLHPLDQGGMEKRGICFRVVTTNCITGKAEYPQVSDLRTDLEFIRASSAQPLAARMVPIDGYVYMDGAVADAIPVRYALENNEKAVVILTQPEGYRKNPLQPLMPMLRVRYRRYPRFLETLAASNRNYNRTLDYLDEQIGAGKAFVIAPMGPLNIAPTQKDLRKLKRAYDEGYFVAEGLGEKLKEFIGDM